MSAVRDMLRRASQRHRGQSARLPWKELEAEAARQGCSPADIFFDRAGQAKIAPSKVADLGGFSAQPSPSGHADRITP
jgi:hypothetical protein